MDRYSVYWISPRGFANEGDYVYGTAPMIDREVDDISQNFGKSHYLSEHKTLENARSAAIKAARKARKEYHSHETVSIGARKAGHEQTQEEWELVVYGPKAVDQ